MLKGLCGQGQYLDIYERWHCHATASTMHLQFEVGRLCDESGRRNASAQLSLAAATFAKHHVSCACHV